MWRQEAYPVANKSEYIRDFLTGAIMESRKAARSKAVASPPWRRTFSKLSFIKNETAALQKNEFFALIGNLIM